IPLSFPERSQAVHSLQEVHHSPDIFTMKGLKPAVILSHGSGGLGAVRSLARRGVHVTVVAYEQDDPVLWSRHAARRVRVEGRTDGDKERHLLSLLYELPETGAVVLATSDRLVRLISDHRK